MSASDSSFAINARSCSLLANEQEGNMTLLSAEKRYLIPIFQRPYAWEEPQIGKFIGDIFKSYWGADKVIIREPMFIGTMQLTYPKNGIQEIIDGQQRMTTFLLLFKKLKEKYPDCKGIQKMQLNWLRTDVNNGVQQAYLEEMLRDALPKEHDELNSYKRNLKMISELFDEQLPLAEDGIHFDIDDFFDYLTSRVYFVVIETRAQLSKTLQIFNAINTAGLDLNSGDIFKIRMYQYMTQYQHAGKEVFEKISRLYEKIDLRNQQCGTVVTDIRGILKLYQYMLISKHGLPDTLHHLGVDTFYERLFDTLFNDNLWDNFRGNLENFTISIDEIDGLIDARFTWWEKWEEKSGFSAEEACMVHLIWWSRYSFYSDLPSVFLYVFRNDPNSWDKLMHYIRQISKVFFIYSVRYQRIKNNVFYGFMHEVVRQLVHGNFDAMINHINTEIGSEERHNSGWSNLNTFLTNDLTENAKRKNLICRLSAMLSEDYLSSDSKTVRAITMKLFNSNIDIEHIQSYHDKDGNKREQVWADWGIEINSLGNLIVLETTYNRSIGNEVYQNKIPVYRKSMYQIVQAHLQQHPEEWNKEKAVLRKEAELKKITAYLFDGLKDQAPESPHTETSK
ncbi:MAG: hypothetical protein RIT43_426 [Bacteroidota bacterium]